MRAKELRELLGAYPDDSIVHVWGNAADNGGGQISLSGPSAPERPVTFEANIIKSVRNEEERGA